MLDINAVGPTLPMSITPPKKTSPLSRSTLHVVSPPSLASSIATKGILPNFVGLDAASGQYPPRSKLLQRPPTPSLVKASRAPKCPRKIFSNVSDDSFPKSDTGNKLTHQCFMAVHETRG
jgi:hypothetical protein